MFQERRLSFSSCSSVSSVDTIGQNWNIWTKFIKWALGGKYKNMTFCAVTFRRPGFFNRTIDTLPLYVATDLSKCNGISGLPQTMVSSSNPVNNESRGTGITLAMPSRTAADARSNSWRRNCFANWTYSCRFSAVTCEYLKKKLKNVSYYIYPHFWTLFVTCS